MSDYTSASDQPRTASRSAVGGYYFAGTILATIGLFQFVTGLAAVWESEFFVIGRNYAFEVDVTAWGWIHMLVGVGLVLTGWGLFTAQTWARVAGVTGAVLSAVANFLFMPYYPFWAVTIIALDVWVIWSLTRTMDTEASA